MWSRKPAETLPRGYCDALCLPDACWWNCCGGRRRRPRPAHVSVLELGRRPDFEVDSMAKKKVRGVRSSTPARHFVGTLSWSRREPAGARILWSQDRPSTSWIWCTPGPPWERWSSSARGRCARPTGTRRSAGTPARATRRARTQCIWKSQPRYPSSPSAEGAPHEQSDQIEGSESEKIVELFNFLSSLFYLKSPKKFHENLKINRKQFRPTLYWHGPTYRVSKSPTVWALLTCHFTVQSILDLLHSFWNLEFVRVAKRECGWSNQELL